MIAGRDLRDAPNALAPHYARARVAERLLLSGHSHQAWPDVAVEGQLEAFEDATRLLDDKWERAEAKADAVRAGFARLLGDPGAQIALGVSTHELLVRFLSALELRARPRLVTTDGEFHSMRRQLGRLGEAGVEVVRVGAAPVGTLAERLAAAVDDRTAAVLVSAVLFETALAVPHLDDLADACAARGAELLVDVYHALGPLPTAIHEQGLADAWIIGGGYKYLQLGEGNCFLRLPRHAEAMRPVVTGWFAEFGLLAETATDGTVAYGAGAARFAGSTYDPTSHYRAARVFAFFEEQGLTPTLLHESYRHQVDVLARAFDDLGVDPAIIDRDRLVEPEARGGFLALRAPRAGELRADLHRRGVLCDSRGTHLRLGPAPYLADAQLEESIGVLGDVLQLLDETSG